jgi:hypothetical protein
LSAEAEHQVVANDVAEAYWLWKLLQELHTMLMKSTLIYCNNVNVVYLSTNPIQHQCMKHIKIDLHFVRERVIIGDVRILHVPAISYFTNIFMKDLPTLVFLEFQFSLSIHSS